jgi:hypothetical protein
MATDLCYQLKINNGINPKLTLKHNPKPDRTIIYRFGEEKKTYHEFVDKRYLNIDIIYCFRI